MNSRLLCLAVTLALAGVAHSAPVPPPQPVEATKEQQLSVVRVNVTQQPYDFFHPWTKRAPYSRRALGVVLPNKRVLITAEMVSNATFVELEKGESGEKIAASVEAVDYEANLALLKAADEKFLAALKPIDVKDARVGDRVAVWQLEATGALLITSGIISTIEVSRYPVEDISLLTYHMTSSLQYRDGSFTVPVVKDDKLAGLLMRYDPRSQNADVIPAPVISHFLKEAARPEYHGFPRAGLTFLPTRDPQLRRYLKLNNGTSGGVFVSQVQKGSPADRAGLRVNDVILAIGESSIDQDGNYLDKQHGKISLVHLISTKTFHGEKLPFKIVRAGEPLTIEVTLTHQAAESYIIPPYTIDKEPRYYVLGGLVFQELSRQYLKEWGDWVKKAPARLVYYDRYQAELFADDPREKLVILSQVLPSQSTVGYEDLGYIVVEKVNGIALKSLSDLPAALAKPVDGFHKIELADNPRVIHLDAAQVKAEEPALLQNYGLPAISNLE